MVYESDCLDRALSNRDREVLPMNEYAELFDRKVWNFLDDVGIIHEVELFAMAFELNYYFSIREILKRYCQ